MIKQNRIFFIAIKIHIVNSSQVLVPTKPLLNTSNQCTHFYQKQTTFEKRAKHSISKHIKRSFPLSLPLTGAQIFAKISYSRWLKRNSRELIKDTQLNQKDHCKEDLRERQKRLMRKTSR